MGRIVDLIESCLDGLRERLDGGGHAKSPVASAAAAIAEGSLNSATIVVHRKSEATCGKWAMKSTTSHGIIGITDSVMALVARNSSGSESRTALCP